MLNFPPRIARPFVDQSARLRTVRSSAGLTGCSFFRRGVGVRVRGRLLSAVLEDNLDLGHPSWLVVILPEELVQLESEGLASFQFSLGELVRLYREQHVYSI